MIYDVIAILENCNLAPTNIQYCHVNVYIPKIDLRQQKFDCEE